MINDTGREWQAGVRCPAKEEETGLDYFLARYYSSAQGRFTSPDEFSGGPREFWVLGSGDNEKQALPYADVTNPQSLNKYQYCLNNSLRYVDPDGHQDSADLNMQREDRAYLAGKITKEELMARRNARAAGALVAVGLVLAWPLAARIGQGLLIWAAANPDKVERIVAALQEASGGPPGTVSGAGGMSKAEYSFAQKLAGEGKNVERLAESTLRGIKSGDFLVNGIKAELKTLDPFSNAATLKNAIARGVGQGGGNVLIDARSTGVTLAEAQKAAARVFGADNRLQVVRIVGKAFDITIARKAK